tara:strand:+ start:24878 stop:26485 length:1608 start_codon:yes stop_codon:yes gene_type:complete
MQNSKRYSCPDCGSSDGVMIDPEDGHTFCFACGVYNSKYKGNKMDEPITDTDNNFELQLNDIHNYPSLDMPSRRISKKVVEFFGVKTHQYNDKPAHFYPYDNDCYKVRILPKEFRLIGKPKKLFGQREFGSGGKMLVITEGELDALSVAQASMDTNNRIWPVVSIPSANQLQVVLENRNWIRQFEKVVIWMDADEAGQKAITEISKIIGFDKVRIVNLNGKEKDASDVYMTSGAAQVSSVIWNASSYSPAGIVVGEKIWERFQERQKVQSIPYPKCLDGLNEKLKGLRFGEISLFTSGTGSGKSTVLKEIILNILNTTDSKVGLISLEESVGDTAEKFIGMQINKRIGDDDVPISQDLLRSGFESIFSDERLILLDHQGSVGDNSLIDKMEYMALMGCKYLVLDHITIAVSEGSEGLSGNEAIDKVMSDLLKVVKKHDVWLGLVSHLRKSGSKAFEEGNMASIDDVKGSGSIKQISFDIIAFSRNLTAHLEEERNQIKLTVLKSRFTGKTGPAGTAIYDSETGRLKDGSTEFGIL